MKKLTNAFVVHFNLKGTFNILNHSVLRHHCNRYSEPELIGMGHRKLDIYVFLAFARMVGSIVRASFAKKRYTPAYLFTVSGVEIGKVLSSVAMRDVRANLSPVVFALRYVAAFFRGAFVLGSAYRSRNRVGAIFLGDVFSMDGIWVDYFLQRDRVAVYLDLYPFGLICVEDNYSNLSELRASMESRLSCQTLLGQERVQDYMDARLSKPEAVINYYSASVERKLNFHLDSGIQRVAVLYAHSFTDAQMERGFDGFKNVFDWTLFTVETIVSLHPDVTLIIKAHPNFFSDQESVDPRSASTLDLKIWRVLLSKLPASAIVVDFPITNERFLSELAGREAILISHHGNAVIEGAYLGFRTISSRCSPWGDLYTIGKTWSSKDEYFTSLKEMWVDYPSPYDVKEQSSKFVADVYLSNLTEIQGSRSYWNVISRHSGIEEVRLMSQPFADIDIDFDRFEEMIDELANGVTRWNGDFLTP